MEKVALRRDGHERLSASQRNSSIDFNDVFGGPPRRSSMQDMQDGDGDDDDDDETNMFRTSWSSSGTNEKPVFGEHVSGRSYTKDYFFGDIFKVEKQQYLSSPGSSRVLSPARPLPPKVEPFAPSSLPAQFSLPANLSRAIDLPAFGSSAHSTYKTMNSSSHGTQISSTPEMSPDSSPRFSNEAVNCQEELTHDVRSYRPSPLSYNISLSGQESLNSDISDKGDMSKKDFDLENTKNGSQFHFSIYKWASIGVPSLIPIRTGINSSLKEKTKFELTSSLRSWIASKSSTDNLHNPNASAVADTLAADEDSTRMDYNGSSENNVISRQTDQESDPFAFETANKNSSSLARGDDITKKDKSQQPGPRKGSQSSHERVSAKKSDEESTAEARKSEARSLHAPLSNEEYDRGSNKIFRKSEVKNDKDKATKKSSVVHKKQKKQDEEYFTQIDEQANKSSLHGSSTKKENDKGAKKVKGKVKDFVNIFNQETSSSPKVDIDSRSNSNRWKNYNSKNEKKESVETTKKNDKMKVPDVNAKKMSPEASMKADEYLKESRHQHSARKASDYVPNDNSAGQKDGSASNTASIPDRVKATDGVPEEYFSGSFQVNEVFQAEDEPPKKDNNQAFDAKIRKWSSGKEGNIRSLLSTLQYVLWPDSGWKPVPLVDIIEGNAVKRAYQKALLRLHPDKLQQKGATSHQKYIAEKVFDILQEAWDHFNSLNSY